MSGRAAPARRTKHPRDIPLWHRHAACSGSDIEFVPDASDLRSELLAKAVCSRCPVRLACRDDALAHGHNGIRGGRTEAEREWMKQGRRRAPTCR